MSNLRKPGWYWVRIRFIHGSSVYFPAKWQGPHWLINEHTYDDYHMYAIDERKIVRDASLDSGSQENKGPFAAIAPTKAEAINAVLDPIENHRANPTG